MQSQFLWLLFSIYLCTRKIEIVTRRQGYVVYIEPAVDVGLINKKKY